MMNTKKKSRGMDIKTISESADIIPLPPQAARAFDLDSFEEWMTKISSTKKLSPEMRLRLVQTK